MLDLLDADLYASYVWNPQNKAFERGVAINMDDSYVEKSQNYFQHCHATTTRQWIRQGANPVSTVIPHRDLMQTEIYNDFLRPSGHYYGINLFAFDGRDNIGDIQIWRRNGHSDFDRDEVGLLSLIAPGFTQALKRIETRAQLKPQASPRSAKLSPRETEVAGFAAQGLSNKQIARRLDLKVRDRPSIWTTPSQNSASAIALSLYHCYTARIAPTRAIKRTACLERPPQSWGGCLAAPTCYAFREHWADKNDKRTT